MLRHAIFLGLCLTTAALGDEITISPTIGDNLQTLADYRVHRGRIVVDTGHFAGRVRLKGPHPSTPERLEMEVDGQHCQIHYRQTTSQQEVELRLERDGDGGWDVQLERRAQGPADVQHVRFVQRPGEPLELKIEGERPFRAATLWQLWYREPQACEEHLQPLLALLRPDWNLSATYEDAQRLRGIFDERDTAQARARWQSLVDELGSSRHTQREAAQRQLRRESPGVLAFLLALPTSTLDAEQRRRVQHLLSPHLLPGEDTPLTISVDW
jgi:hypothetical protein